MSNAGTVVLRLARKGLQQASTCRYSLRAESKAGPGVTSLLSKPFFARPTVVSVPGASQCAPQQRCFSQLTRRGFRQSFAAYKLKPYESDKKPEKGLRFRKDDLNSQEVMTIFGPKPPPVQFANRLLRVLHGRRLDGTLDLPLPDDVQSELHKYPYAFDDGLHWLRQTYPIDEDAAILARIEREEHALERDNPAELMQRGQDLRLYQGPQSGHYHAPLSGKEGDVFGVSELDRMRAENEAAAKREEEELQAQIDKRMAQVQTERSQSLAQRPEQGLEAADEFRPPNTFEKWVLLAQNRAQSKLTLESPEIVQRGLLHRLLPSFLLVSILCGASYLYSQYWARPRQSDRFFPNISLSFATVGTLIALNLAVFAAWRFPPLWTSLNKYFIITPAYPYAFSMLGSLFSHQKFTHLLANMLTLILFGVPLHEEVGRGTFVAIYLCSGLVGSFASLARHAVQRNWLTSSLGASGCTYGVVAAYLYLHAQSQFSILFLPPDMAEKFSFTGATILAALTVYHIIRALGPAKKIDYVDHLGGLAVGVVAARWWKNNREKEREEHKKNTPWWQSIVGSTNTGSGK
ncbi:hypothetical protein A1O1_02438 [Capronia coronata CBS 617.96]|uniref:Peptidase S54 rhomboid domain-containing protein n=1 Tax=Capronia coronata CBS 617.96 TaxID=1182541 RepID=W9YWJ1_9EURO|nr:uncharacterized protein A1O1_02438 [Capronia coronata CBS 617.96]EXJ94045.1 hypothetical protein A1O1_02438 [Capronia coronata CBS 617.96]